MPKEKLPQSNEPEKSSSAKASEGREEEISFPWLGKSLRHEEEAILPMEVPKPKEKETPKKTKEEKKTEHRIEEIFKELEE